ASSTSWCSSASRTRSSCSSTMSIAPSADCSRALSSSWKCLRPSPVATALPELARDVLLGPTVVGLGEDLLSGAVFDQLAVEHERGRVRDARGLLHVVRDDDDRVALLELVDELLDLQGRDRVQRGGGLIHEDDLGLDGDRARDAQALLLAAGEADARLTEAVLDLLPQAGAAQRLLDALLDVEPVGPPAKADARRDVVVD